jgi:hypothetical protein
MLHLCNGERVMGPVSRDSDQPGFPPTQPNQDYCQVLIRTGPSVAASGERHRTPRRLDQEAAGGTLRADHAVSRSNISIEGITGCELRTLKGHSAEVV